MQRKNELKAKKKQQQTKNNKYEMPLWWIIALKRL